MPPSRTKTIKNKKAGAISGSKATKSGPADGIVHKSNRKGPPPGSKSIHGKNALDLLLKKRRQKKVYAEKELGLPQLNTVTPIGVTKPKGKKKGKVFVDDNESMNTIMAMVQADKEGQIESKMIKARQMEEIREARRVEAEKKEEERQSRLDETKDSLRRKRKRNPRPSDGTDAVDDAASAGTKAAKPKKKKSVAFA